MDIDTDGEYLSDSDSNEARQIPRKKIHRYGYKLKGRYKKDFLDL